MPAARPPVLFRETAGKSASALPPAPERRALFDSIRARRADAAFDAVDSKEAEAPRRRGARNTGASSASLRFLLASSPARAARPRTHSSRA